MQESITANNCHFHVLALWSFWVSNSHYEKVELWPTIFEMRLLDKKVVSVAEPHGIIFYPLMKENIFDVTLAMFNTDPVHCFVCFLTCENVCPYVIFCASPNFFFCLLTSQPCKWICQVKQHQMLSRDSDTFLCSVILTISVVKKKKKRSWFSFCKSRF